MELQQVRDKILAQKRIHYLIEYSVMRLMLHGVHMVGNRVEVILTGMDDK